VREKPIKFASLVKLLEEAVGEKTSYALLDPFPCKTLEYGKPAVIAIQQAGKTIAQHLGLGDYMFVIAVTAQKPDIAAHIELDHSGRDVYVELNREICACRDAVLATLCHELSHKFLHRHGIRNGTTVLEQEFLTDVTAVYLGLGKIMLNGCECRNTRQVAHDGQTGTETTSITTGYLSRSCFAFVYRLVCAMRGIPHEIFLRGLSSEATEAVHAAESAHSDWFNAEFGKVSGLALLRDELIGRVGGYQHDSAARDRDIRSIDRQLSAIKRRMNESHRPLKEAQRLVSRLAEDEPNPHLRFLNCLENRELVFQLLYRRDQLMEDVLSEWAHVQSAASWAYRTLDGEITEIVECPLDGTKLRVPVGHKQLLVTCAGCKYRFLVTTAPDREKPQAKENLPPQYKRKRRVLYQSLAILSLSLIVIGFLGRYRGRATLLRLKDKYASQSRDAGFDPWRAIAMEDATYSARSNDQKIVELSPDDVESAPVAVSPKANPAHPTPRGLVKPSVEIRDRPRVPGEPNPDPEVPDVSLPTGTQIMPEGATGGHGELEAVNGSHFDACVIVVNTISHQRVRDTYIKANARYTFMRLAPGQYQIVFATGLDWDPDAERFQRDASYFGFDRMLTYNETRVERQIIYTTYSITLNPVFGGNVRSRPISEQEFHQLAGERIRSHT
jgi:hypothetical protein